MLEYQGCFCGIDKQEIYEDLWEVSLHVITTIGDRQLTYTNVPFMIICHQHQL